MEGITTDIVTTFKEDMNNDLISYLKTQINRINDGSDIQNRIEKEFIDKFDDENDEDKLSNSEKIKLLEIFYKYKSDINSSILGILKETQKIQINNAFPSGTSPKTVTPDILSIEEMTMAKQFLKSMAAFSAMEKSEIPIEDKFFKTNKTKI